MIMKHCWRFYWLLTSKMTRIDEFSSGYEYVQKAAAAAVKAYKEMTSCAFKMIHVFHSCLSSPVSPHTADLFPRSHQQQLSLQFVHTREVSVPAAECS